MSGANVQIRLGLVLYGGISLAVYMNGIVQELLDLVRASHARRMAESAPDSPYVQAQRATNPYYRLLEAAGVEVVIDVIAGTSAGGLNGLILAKALAVGAPDLSVMTTLWQEQAQIDKLSTHDKQPVSLLSGQFLKTELEKALQHLSRCGDPDLARQVQALDLFVTATDVRGHRWTRRDTLQQPVQEVTHSYLFHLRKRTADPATGRSYDQNDFAHPDRERQRRIDHLLAKIGQATAALPGAFPPVRIDRAEAEAAGLHLLDDVEAPAEGIWFSDGGILMNRPFEPVVRTVIQRSSAVPSRRLIAFLEPAADPVAAPAQTEPNLLENALAGLTLTLQQDIVDDLERLARENEHRRALQRLLLELDEAVGEEVPPWAAPDQPAAWLPGQPAREAPDQRVREAPDQRARKAPDQGAREALAWVAPARDPLARAGAPGFLPGAASPLLLSYYALRQGRLRETLEAALGGALAGVGLTGAARDGALAAILAEVPLLCAPASDPAVPEFLARFDAEFQQRRLHYLITRIQQQYRPGVIPSDRGAMTALLDGLWGALEDWRNAAWVVAHAGRLGLQPAPWTAATRRLDRAFQAMVQAMAGTPGAPTGGEPAGLERVPTGGEPAGLKRAAQEAVAAIDGYLGLVFERTAAEVERALAAARRALPLRESATGQPCRPPRGPALTAERLVRSYAEFESRDLILFPLRTYGAAGEWAEIGLMRLGADGAQGWVRKSAREKLTGTRLHHFGAFLDGRWRANDIMWGRLDGAELLTRMVVLEAGLLKEGVELPPGGEALPESAYDPRARQALADRRLQIAGAFPELIDMKQVRQPGGTGRPEGEEAADWALRRYLQEDYRITGLDELPRQRLAAVAVTLLHNLTAALKRSGPTMGGLRRLLLAVLRPLYWSARLVLLLRQVLAFLRSAIRRALGRLSRR